MCKFEHLSLLTQAKLFPLITYWGMNSKKHADIKSLNECDINDPLDVSILANGDIFAQYAITYAVLLDDSDMLRELCKLGADIDCMDEFHQNKTPLELAVELGRANIAKILLAAGGKPTVRCVAPDMSILTNPIGFAWTMKERFIHGRQVDYDGLEQVGAIAPPRP